MNKPVVLAFAGGLHASAAIPWLIDTMGVEVVTVTLDVGQGHELGELRGADHRLGIVEVVRESVRVDGETDGHGCSGWRGEPSQPVPPGSSPVWTSRGQAFFATVRDRLIERCMGLAATPRTCEFALPRADVPVHASRDTRYRT